MFPVGHDGLLFVGCVDLFGDCVKTDAATVLTAADDLGLESNLLAILATRGEVVSVFLVDICLLPSWVLSKVKLTVGQQRRYPDFGIPPVA